MAGVQDVPGGDLQGIVLAACHRAVGTHLVAPGDPALSRCVPLQRGSDAPAACLGIDPECLDVALRKRLAMVHHRGPDRAGADHLDQVAQKSDAPAAGESAEYVRLLGVRETRDKVAILGQYLGRQGEHRLEAGRPGLDLAHLDPKPGLGAGIIHLAIMAAAGREEDEQPGPGRRSL